MSGRMVYEVRSGYIGKGGGLDELLADGWEPFASDYGRVLVRRLRWLANKLAARRISKGRRS